jgi:hypothetical protein
MISQLVDIEWKFGVTSATNLIDKLGNPFLQLKIVYSSGGKLDSKFIGKNKQNYFKIKITPNFYLL